jgi:Holliday junction resolvasome RuvABC endonuclease subunit
MEQLLLPNPAEHICIALDIGTRYTGVSVWDRGSFSRVTQLTVSHSLTARTAVTVFSGLVAMLKQFVSSRSKDVILVVEDYAYGGGFFNAHQAEAIGLLKDYVIERGWSMVFLAPGTVKKHVTGNGKAKKGEVKKAVKALGYDVKSSHEADSISLYLTYTHVWCQPTDSVFRRAILR